MPCNAKNTPVIQAVLRTPPNVAGKSQSVSSHLGADFWQDIENDGLMMIQSMSPLRGCTCKTPNSNRSPQKPTPRKRWKRRRLIRTGEPVPSGDRNPQEENVPKKINVADNSPSVKKCKTKRRRRRRKSNQVKRGTPVFVSNQEDAAETVENIDGESSTPVKSIPKQTDPAQVLEKSTLDCVDPLKAPMDPLKKPVDPLNTGQKRVTTEVAAVKVKRLKKNSLQKELESAGHPQNYHSGKAKVVNTSGNTSLPVECSTPVGVLSTEHLPEPQRTSIDLNRFETPKSTRLHQISTLEDQKQKCKRNTPVSGKTLEEAEITVQSTDENHRGAERERVLHQQQTPQMTSPANLSLTITLADLLQELSASERSRLSSRLAKAKIACHEEKRQQRISLKRKCRKSVGELNLTPGIMSQTKDNLLTAKSPDISLPTSLTNPSEMPSISDESFVKKHHQTRSKVPHEQSEGEVAINKSPVKRGSDFDTPKQKRTGAELTCCALCSCSCKCPPSVKTSFTASEGTQTPGTVNKGIQISPDVFRPDEPELVHTMTSTYSSFTSQSWQTDFHEGQTQTVQEMTSFAKQLPPEDCSTSIPPSDQKEEPRKATEVNKIKTFFDSSLSGPTDSKPSSRPTPLLRRQSHRRRRKFAVTSNSTRQMDSVHSQSSSEATTLKSHCLSPVIQLVKLPPVPGETLPRGLPLNFMKFSKHCGRRSVREKQMRMPQELFSSSGGSDSDVGRARAAAQRFINMTEGQDSDDRLSDWQVDDGEKVGASQQVWRRKYRGSLDDNDGRSNGVDFDDVDSADGQERSSQSVIQDVGGNYEQRNAEEYIGNDEISEQQAYSSDEEDDDQTIVGTSASDDDGGGDVSSRNETQEEWCKEHDDEEDYGNIFILDQATESRLKDEAESDGYSDASSFDIHVPDESQSEILTEEDIIKDRQQTQTTDNQVNGMRLSPRKNRRRILAGLFSSSEESNPVNSQASEVAHKPKESYSHSDKRDHLLISTNERVAAKQLLDRRNIRGVLDDNSSSLYETESDTTHNSLVEDSQQDVLHMQMSSNIFLDDNESVSVGPVKPKKRLKPTGLLTIRGKMLKKFREQAEKEMTAGTCSSKGKQTKSQDIKQRGDEFSHHKIASKDDRQGPICNSQVAKYMDRDNKGLWDGNDLDDEVFHQDASDRSQDEGMNCTLDGDFKEDENVDGHVNNSRDEEGVLKGDSEDIGGSDSDDTSLNIPDFDSSDNDPEIYEGLLKKKKSQRTKQSERTGLLSVKRKMSRSDGKLTKSRKVKKDRVKTNRRRSTYEEQEKDSRNYRRGLSSQAVNIEGSGAFNNMSNLNQDDELGNDENVAGPTIIDRSEGGDSKDNEEDMGSLDSDDTIVNFMMDDKNQVSGEASAITLSTKALQPKEVTKVGLHAKRKSSQRTGSKKSLDLTGSSENDADNQKKRRSKEPQKMTGLLTAKGEMKNKQAVGGKQTKLRNTTKSGKTDRQQRMPEEQQGEPRRNEKDLHGHYIENTNPDLDGDENEDEDDASLNLLDDISHWVRSPTGSLRQSEKLTQTKTKKPFKNGLLTERKSPQRNKSRKSLDQTGKEEDSPKSHDGLLDKSKSSKKLTQKTPLPEMTEKRKTKKNLLAKKREREKTDENLHLDNFNETLNTGEPVESQRQRTPTILRLLKQQAKRKKTKDKLVTDDEQTKSYESKQRDGRTNHRERRASEEHQGVARKGMKDLEHQAGQSTDADTESDCNTNNDCVIEVANGSISEVSFDKKEVYDDDLDDGENEDTDDGSLNSSDNENHGLRSRTSSSGQCQKETKTKKSAVEGGLKERKSPRRKTTKKSLDVTGRKEDDPDAGLLDKSKPLKKLRHKTQPKKTEKQAESKKINSKVAATGLKIKLRKAKQVDIQTRLIKETPEDIYGDSTVDNLGEDTGSTDHEGGGDIDVISKTHNWKKSTRSKKAKPEKALSRESIKERNLPKKSGFRKSIKIIATEEVVAGLTNKRKSTKTPKQTSTGGKSVDKDHGGTSSKVSNSIQSTKFTRLKSKGDTKERKTPKTAKSKKNLAVSKLLMGNGLLGKSSPISIEKSDGDSSDSDCYIEAVNAVLYGKRQIEIEDDSSDDGSTDEESLGGNLMDDKDKDRAANSTSDGDACVREAGDSRRKSIDKYGMKKKLQIGGDGVRSHANVEGGDVQDICAEEVACKDDDGFDSNDSSLPPFEDDISDVSYNTRNRETETNSGNSSARVEQVQVDKHSSSSEEISDDRIAHSGFLSASKWNACPFDHMSKSCRGKKHGCSCIIGNSPRAGKTRRKAPRNPVLTGGKELNPHSDSVQGKPKRTRLRKPRTINGLLKDKGKKLKKSQQEAARKVMENKPATDVKLQDCKSRSNFEECNYKHYNPIMYTFKSDTNRAICESLITPMPQEWDEPTISDKDREDHGSALRSIFYELLLKRGRKNRIAARRFGKLRINRGPTVKELKKANTAEKRRLKKLEAEVNSDGWIEYDMLPAVYQEVDATDFIKEIK